MMSPERRGTLVEVFLNPEEYQAFLAELSMKEALYDDYMAAVTFTDDDLLLGTTEHNRPLYVTGTSQGTTIKILLINPGSSFEEPYSAESADWKGGDPAVYRTRIGWLAWIVSGC